MDHVCSLVMVLIPSCCECCTCCVKRVKLNFSYRCTWKARMGNKA